jgi:hypothetical protein
LLCRCCRFAGVSFEEIRPQRLQVVVERGDGRKGFLEDVHIWHIR